MKKIFSFIFIFLAMLIWGTSFLAMKNTLDYINSGFLIFSRAIITFIILLPLSIKQFKNLKKENIILIIVSGFFISLGYLTQAVGLKYTTPGKSAFLEDAYCLTVPILTSIILKKRLKPYNLLSILLCVGGVILISIDSLNGGFSIGEVLSLIAGISYGFNIALTGIYSKGINPILYTCCQFFIISIISGVYTFVFEDNSLMVFNNETIFSILYLGLIVTALAWIFRNYAQQDLSPLTVSVILPFSAVVGGLISVIAKEDILTYQLIFGGLLITSSILVDAIVGYKINKASQL